MICAIAAVVCNGHISVSNDGVVLNATLKDDLSAIRVVPDDCVSIARQADEFVGAAELESIANDDGLIKGDDAISVKLAAYRRVILIIYDTPSPVYDVVKRIDLISLEITTFDLFTVVDHRIGNIGAVIVKLAIPHHALVTHLDHNVEAVIIYVDDVLDEHRCISAIEGDLGVTVPGDSALLIPVKREIAENVVPGGR